GDSYIAMGVLWLVYLDVRNQAQATQALGNTISWTLYDSDHGTFYHEMGSFKQYAMNMQEFAILQGRDSQGDDISPAGITHSVLVFDVPATTHPTELEAYGIGSRGLAFFNLKPKTK